MKLIGNNLTNWGIPEIHPYAAVVNAMNWETVPPRIKTRLLFRFYGGMQKAGWGASPAEKQYWIENGLLSGGKPWKQHGGNHGN